MQSNPNTNTPTAAETVADFLKNIDRLGIRAEQLKALTDALIVCSTHKSDEGTCESLRYLASELATDVRNLVSEVDSASCELCELATRSESTSQDAGTFELVPAGADACDPPATADALGAVPDADQPTT